jgi:hypothetical protein
MLAPPPVAEMPLPHGAGHDEAASPDRARKAAAAATGATTRLGLAMCDVAAGHVILGEFLDDEVSCCHGFSAGGAVADLGDGLWETSKIGA